MPDDPPARNPEAATTAALCGYFLRLGATGFGGPVALAGYMQRDLVNERGWVSEQEYRDGLAIAQMAPGPLAAQLAMWLAFIRQGIRGATLVSVAFVAPPFAIVVALAALYVGAGGAHWIGSLFYGVAPAAIAIIAVAAYRLLPLTVARDPLLWGAAIAVGLITLFTNSEVALAFIAAGVIVAAIKAGPRLLARGASAIAGGASGQYLPASAASQIEPALIGSLALFFLKAGAFVFGSGLAIVPFLHQGVVVDNHWLTEEQFLDAVAVGLITPGPVVITAAFVGYLVAGLPGAFVASLGVFLPPYLFVVVPGRWILAHKDSPTARGFVAGVSAAAAGAIVAASVILGRQAIVDAATAVIGLAALCLLVALRRAGPPILRRSPELPVVALAGLAGLLLRGF